jgi:hypothetical protein
VKIAELFVNLGLKGKDSVASGLKSVKGGLGETKSMALETKAAILAVVYGLEKMMSQSAQAGTGLSQFTALTNIAAGDLQRWQYAMRQTGGSAEELTGNLKAVQNTMTNMLLGKGAPEGMAMLANKVGFDPKRARDTLYVMSKLQEFVQKVPSDVGNQMAKSFGISEGTIAAMRKNAFRPEVFAKAPTYSDKEVSTLNKVDVAWGNLGQKIQMAFGHMTAKDGLKIVNEISKITTEVFKLADALLKLADKIKIFEKIGMVFSGWAQILNGVTGGVGKITGDKGGVLEGLKNTGKDAASGVSLAAEGAWMTLMEKFGSPTQPQAAASNNNVTVNQNLNFQHDGKDARKTGESAAKAVKDAYRQMSAQSQGT